MAERDEHLDRKGERPRGRQMSRRGLLFGAFNRVRDEVSHSAEVIRSAGKDGSSSVPSGSERDSAAARSTDPSGSAPKFVARVLAFNCIARTGCVSCVEHCRVPGALELVGIKPVVNEDICTGCGDCRGVCPAPSPAIEILPKLPPRNSNQKRGL